VFLIIGYATDLAYPNLLGKKGYVVVVVVVATDLQEREVKIKFLAYQLHFPG